MDNETELVGVLQNCCGKLTDIHAALEKIIKQNTEQLNVSLSIRDLLQATAEAPIDGAVVRDLARIANKFASSTVNEEQTHALKNQGA